MFIPPIIVEDMVLSRRVRACSAIDPLRVAAVCERYTRDTPFGCGPLARQSDVVANVWVDDIMDLEEGVRAFRKPTDRLRSLTERLPSQVLRRIIVPTTVKDLYRI